MPHHRPNVDPPGFNTGPHDAMDSYEEANEQWISADGQEQTVTNSTLTYYEEWLMAKHQTMR